jgi:hypothetical protein
MPRLSEAEKLGVGWRVLIDPLGGKKKIFIFLSSIRYFRISALEY